MTRYLGIDFGSKRIGLAVSDTESSTASPVASLPVRGSPAEVAGAVAAVATEYDVDEFVVGLPLNMDGTEGVQVDLTRKFGVELARVAGLPVNYHDERLSSQAAGQLLAPAELSRKKRRRRLDPVAAMVMLQDFLDRQPTGIHRNESQESRMDDSLEKTDLLDCG